MNNIRGLALKTGAKWVEISQLKEIYPLVYQAGQKHDAVVCLKRHGKGGAHEDFSQLYRYLIDTRLITTKSLQQILLLADNHDDTGVSYGPTDLSDIEKLRRLSERTQLLQAQQPEFEQLRANCGEVEEQEQGLREALQLFDFHCTCVRAQIQTERGEYRHSLEEAESRLRAIKESLRTAQVNLGSKQEAKRQAEKRVAQSEQRVAQIQQLEPREWFTTSIENVQQDLDRITFRLGQLMDGGESVEKIERRMHHRRSQIDRLGAQHANCGNWLIHHLATGDGDRRRLNALLHPNVARADSAHLISKITSTEGEIPLYDGRFTLPELAEAELPTPESLLAEIRQLESEQESDGRILETAKNRAAVEAEKRDKEQLLTQLRKQLELLETLPEREAEVSRLQAETQVLAEAVAGLHREITRGTEDEKRQQTHYDILREKEKTRESRLQDIDGMRRRVERFGVQPAEGELLLPAEAYPDLKALFNDLERKHQRWDKLQLEIDHLFTLLRRALNAETADVHAFLDEVEQEFAGLADVTATIGSLVDSITLRFANPAAHLLARYENFKDFINQKFNRGLAQLTISNIEQLRIELVPSTSLQSDLRQISQLNLGGGGLFKGEGHELKLLHTYIDQGKNIAFTDLFTLQLKLCINGREKVVDLSKQVESDGTDRMLRLVIVMQVISRMADLDADNRLVVFIDEIATIDARNRPQLVEFCKRHHFYPIFCRPRDGGRFRPLRDDRPRRRQHRGRGGG